MKTNRATAFSATAVAALVTFANTAFSAPGAVYNVGAPSVAYKSDAPKTREASHTISPEGGVSYTVPFDVPPGRAGMQPSVALEYSSRSPLRGGVAAGWTLPLSYISVDTSAGRAQGVKYQVNGRRLIEVPEPAGVAGMKLYRADGDDTFTRYERTNDGTEAGAWIARTPDGKTFHFGLGPNSKDVRTEGRSGTPQYGGEGRWFLTLELDSSGNQVEYKYATVYGSARNGAVANTPVDVVLTSIEYGRNGSVEHHAKIEFAWQDQLSTCPGSNVPIGAQFTYRTGIRRYEGAKKLLAIRSYVKTAPGSSWVKRRELSLGYRPERCDLLQGPTRVLDHVQLTAWSPEGVSTTLPPMSFEYGPSQVTFDEGAEGESVELSTGLNPHNAYKPGGWPALLSTRMDLDGDGTAELVRAEDMCEVLPDDVPWANGSSPSQSSFIHDREGCSLTAKVTHRSTQRTFSCGLPTNYYGYRYMDVNGDGLLDLVTSLNYQKGRYRPTEDSAAQAGYPACINLAQPSCMDQQWNRVPCLFSPKLQRVHPLDKGWDGTRNDPPYQGSTFSKVSAAEEDDDGDQDNDGHLECMDGACTKDAICADAESKCCSVDFCPPKDEPTFSPPGGFSNLFAGPRPTANEKPIAGGEGIPNELCGTVPDMHCGHYVMDVYLNKGNAADGSWFEPVGRRIFAPVPLESEQMIEGGSVNATNWRAIVDIDGDNKPDALYQRPGQLFTVYDSGYNDFNFWFGLGDGNFRGRPDGTAFLWTAPPGPNGARPIITGSGSKSLATVTVNGELYGTKTGGSGHVAISSNTQLSDVNGDGLLDYVRTLGTTTTVFYNTGFGFEQEGTVVSTTLESTTRSIRVSPMGWDPSTREYFPLPAETSYTIKTVRKLDVDQDGLEDIVALTEPPSESYNPFSNPSGGTVRGHINTGDRFIPVAGSLLDMRNALAGVSVESDEAWRLVSDVTDLNGDGIYDLVEPTDPNGPYCRVPLAGSLPDYWDCGLINRVRYADSVPLHLLTAVNSGTGARVAFQYASSNESNVVSRADGSRLTSPVWVAKSVTITSGTPYETEMVSEYRYADPVSNFDRLGRHGFRGFETMTTLGPVTSTGRRARTTNTYAFDQDPEGLLARSVTSEVFTTNGREDLLSITDHAYEALPLFQGQLAGQELLRVFANKESRTYLCKAPPAGTSAAAIAQCLGNAAMARTIYTWQPRHQTPDAPYTAPVLAHVLRETRRTDSVGAVQPGDRIETYDWEFRYSGSQHRLLKTGTTVRDGAGTQVARTSTTYESGHRALPLEQYVAQSDYWGGTTRYSYDALGNVETMTRPNEVARAQWSWGAYQPKNVRRTYDAFKLHPATVTNELGQVTGTVHDLGTGALLREILLPQAGVTPVVERTIDGLGRVLEKRHTVQSASGGYEVRAVYTASYRDTPPLSVEQRQLQDSRWIVTKTSLDGLGRVTYEEQPSSSGAVTMRRLYDGAGNGAWVYVKSPADGATEVLYLSEFDGLGRVVRSKAPDTAAVGHVYYGPAQWTYEWPSDGGPKHYKYLEHDAFGRLAKVREGYATASITEYRYDAMDRVTWIRDADGIETNIAYDQHGNRTRVQRANTTLVYYYDFHGNRLWLYHPTPSGQIDATKYASSWTYDSLDRVDSFVQMERSLTTDQQARYFDAGDGVTRTTLYRYDQATHRHGNGRLTEVVAPHGTTSYDYTVEGFTERESRRFKVKPEGVAIESIASQSHKYDVAGHVIETAHPDGTVSKYTYDDRGRPYEAYAVLPDGSEKLLGRLQRNAAGFVTQRVTDLRDVHQSWSYDAAGRMTAHQVRATWCADSSCTPGIIAGETAKYYAIGVPKELTDHATNRTFNYRYNDRVELESAQAGTAYDAVYEYSGAGRVLRSRIASDLSGADVVSRDVRHEYAPHASEDRADPAAVRALRDVATGAELAAFFYDPSGNRTRKQQGGQLTHYVYDASDNMRETVDEESGEREVFWYDHAGQRVLTYRSADASLRHRFDGTEMFVDAAGDVSETTADVVLGGHPVARITNHDAGHPELLFHGALGSLMAITDSTGRSTARFGYGPYGEMLYTEGPSAVRFDHRYQAKARDAFSGLSYFGRRYYDPFTLSWTQGDPLSRLLPDNALSEPRRMGLYTYVLHSPLEFVDPDGRAPFLVATSQDDAGRTAFTRGDKAIPIPAHADGQITLRGRQQIPVDANANSGGGIPLIDDPILVDPIPMDVYAEYEVVVTIKNGKVHTVPRFDVRYVGTPRDESVAKIVGSVNLGSGTARTAVTIEDKGTHVDVTLVVTEREAQVQQSTAGAGVEVPVGPATLTLTTGPTVVTTITGGSWQRLAVSSLYPVSGQEWKRRTSWWEELRKRMLDAQPRSPAPTPPQR